jgi:hypothetical protein
MEIGLGKIPTHDPKAVPDRGLEPNAVEAPVGSLGDAHNRSDTGVGCGHYREKALDLIDVAVPLNPLGIKGAREAAAIPVGAVIASAVE